MLETFGFDTDIVYIHKYERLVKRMQKAMLGKPFNIHAVYISDL